MRHSYTPKEIQFVEEHITGCSYDDLAALFNKRFRSGCTRRQMKYVAETRGLRNGLDMRYRAGHPASNTGRTVFRKGHKTWNTMPVGTEVVNSYGWVEVKTGKRIWKLKHRIVWEAAHGKIPKGMKLLCIDGNRRNYALDNLLLVDNRAFATMRNYGLLVPDTELAKTGKLVADVIIKIAERIRTAKRRGRND